MRKRTAALALVMGFGFTQVNAQSFIKKITDNLSGGIKAETNMSGFNLSDMPDAKSTMNFGGTFGWFVKLDLSKHFAIEEDLLVHYRRSTLEQGSIKSDFQYGGIELPIYAMGQWRINKSERFYIGVGPYTEYGLNAKLKAEGMATDPYKKDAVTGKASMTRLTMGAATIIGYEFSNGIQVNAGLKMGFTNALDAGKDYASMTPSTASFGIGYRF